MLKITASGTCTSAKKSAILSPSIPNTKENTVPTSIQILATVVLRAKERYERACESGLKTEDESVTVSRIIERQRAVQALARAELDLAAAIRVEGKTTA